MPGRLRPLDASERLAADAALERVFTTLHLPDLPFAPAVEARMLQLPDARLVLPPEQLGALAAALQARGATTAAFLGEFMWNWDAPPVIEAWHALDLTDPAGYGDSRQWVTGAHEHVLVGADGGWGLIAADGESLLFGGPAWLVAALRTVVGAVREEEDLRDWLAIWAEYIAGGAPGSWQLALLVHLHGAARAEAVARAVGWPDG